jgi:hypothetical protein
MIVVRARKPARAKASGSGQPVLCGCGVRVDAEERLHLIKACAFFRAASAGRTCGRRRETSTRR